MIGTIRKIAYQYMWQTVALCILCSPIVPSMGDYSAMSDDYKQSAPLKNPRHERMCRLMSQGQSAEQATKGAGYRYNSGNTSRIVDTPEFQERLHILIARRTAKSAAIVEVTTEKLIGYCEEARLMADRLNNPQAVIAAIKEMGVLSGKRIERSEQGEPGEFEGLNEQELAEYIGQKMAELGIEIISDDKLDQANDGTRH